jgi:TolB-like protein
MSADPEQEFFADGMTEDIITALSKIPELFVIARNSTFVYKGQAVNIPQVGRELGVRYVLEGSVRRAGQRLRITAQLIDAKDGSHLWAERYDRQAEDVFDVQDEITRHVTTALQVTLVWGETARLWQDGTRNFEAWQYMAQAWDQWYAATRKGAAEARRLAELAVALDPDYGGAWGLIAWTYWFDARYTRTDQAAALLARAEEIIEKLSAAGLAEAQTWHIRSGILMVLGESEAAIAAARRAVELAPGNSEMHATCGEILMFAGHNEEALARARASVRMSPRSTGYYVINLFEALRWNGQLDGALITARDSIARSPDLQIPRINLVSVLTEMGPP